MHDFSFYRHILADPVWQTDDTALSPKVAQWLLHTESLTQKLQGICADFRVERVSEGWQAVDFVPHFAASTKTWVREVLLKGGEQDWIFAQTLLPEETIEQVAQAFLTLGDTPIGLWLFPQQPIRQSLEWRQDLASVYYARRSRLRLRGYPLEIRELFLPAFPFD